MAKETEVLIAKATPVADSGTEGAWKSGICDCCKYGACHKALLVAWCCPSIMLGQVSRGRECFLRGIHGNIEEPIPPLHLESGTDRNALPICFWMKFNPSQLLTRSKLTWLGEPTTSPAGYADTFKIVFILGIGVAILNSIFQCTPDMPELVDDDDVVVVMVPGDCVDWEVNLLNWVNFFFWLYSLVCLIRLRKVVRAKYGIPEECGGNGDWVCAWCCPCLTAVQIAHQTANYESDEAYFFTPTGLSEDIEAIVV